MPRRFTRGGLRALVLLLLATSAGSLAAQRTPYPEFTGERVYVRGVEDVYSTALRETIVRVERRSPRTYYAVIVKSSGDGELATRDYIDALWPRWLATSRRSSLPLDPSRSVVVLLAIDNRQLSVHAGTTLQSDYGLRGETIDREIVQPHFIPHARAGDYLTGMTVLIGEIERWIVLREERRERQAAQEAARRERARLDAAARIVECEKLLAGATLLLGERRQSGLELDAPAERLRALETSLGELSARVEADPYEVLREATALSEELRAQHQSLVRIEAQQSEAATRLAKAEAASGALDESIAAVRRTGVGVGSALAALEQIRESIGGLRDTVTKDPAAALDALSNVEGQLRDAAALVGELPRTDARAREMADRVDQARSALLELLAREDGADLASGSGERGERLEEIDRGIAAAKAHLEDDPAVALEQLEELERRLAALTDASERTRARHLFLTRTVPLALAAAGILLVLAIVGLLALRHARTRRAARERLEAFERRVVAFLDQLDALRRRHELLPYSDPDYKEPMTGATLELYESVDAAHTRLRQRWLEQMETKEACERLLATERPLGTKNAREALRLLDAAESGAETESEHDACIARLDTLEAAHEAADAALKSAGDALARVREQLASIEGGGLPASPYEPDVAFCASAIEDARAALVGDPVGARETLERTREKVSDVGRWTERVLHDLAGADEAKGRLEEAGELAREKRAEGMLLSEEEGDPDPPIARGRDAQAAAVRALERGDTATSGLHIEEAFRCADRALDVIRRQVEASEFCARELPERGEESRRLRERLAGARATRTKLEWGFAADSWVGVARNPDGAAALLESLDPVIDEAGRAAERRVQRYFHASDLLAHAGEQQRRVDALLTATDDRLRELQELAERCSERRSGLTGPLSELDGFIAAHEAVVSEDATRLVRTLRTLLGEVDDAIGEDRPDWPAVEQRLEQIVEGLDAARAAAENDVRLHGRLLARLEEVRGHAARLERLLASSEADRARANRCHHEASAALARLLAEVSTPGSDWEALLDRLEGVAQDLERAESWAKEDIQLAQQAESALRDADRLCERARGFLRHGVSADVSSSRSLLAASREALARQAYEEAVEIATRAERSARDAYDEARREARRVEARRERARRRAEARRRRSSSSSSGWTFGGSSGSSSPFGSSSFGSSSSSFSSGSSSSSWSSGSSQSSW